MRNGAERNRMFAQQIRKKDRQQKKSELRSKFVKTIDQIMECQSQNNAFINSKAFRERLQFLKEQQNHKTTNFQIIKLILSSIHSLFSEHQINSIQQANIVQKLLLADKDSSFFINLFVNNNEYPLQLTIGQFLVLLKQMPSEIFKIIASIRQNIKIYKDLMGKQALNDKSTLTLQQNAAITESFRNSSLKKMKVVFQLRIIGQYCRQYLQSSLFFILVYSKMTENIQFQSKNAQLIQLITDCLIEITAFRPQILKLCAYQLSLQPNILQINEQMQNLKIFINTSLYQTLIPIIYNLSFSQHKLLMSYIHLIGNVIINVKQVSFNQQSQLQKINHFLLTKFKTITFSSLQSFLQQTQKKQQLKEMSFLMVWFLRNQLVIMQNYHMFDHSTTTNSYQYIIQSVNELWFPILHNSLQTMLQITKAFPDDAQCFKSIHTNIMSALDLVKVLFNQFVIHNQHFQNTLKYLQQMQEYIETSALNLQGDFLNKMYDLYFNLLCNCENQQKLYKLIVEKACQGLKLEPKYPKIMKLCAKILSPYSKINYQSKQQIFHIFSQNCDSFLQQLKSQSALYIQRVSMLELYYQAVLQSQNLCTKFQMMSDILNPERIGKVLQLCSMLWQQEKNVDDLLMSLQLLKQLCDRQQYQSLLKYKIQSVGYYEQLEQLSAHTNDKINRLVYQIYELLEII